MENFQKFSKAELNANYTAERFHTFPFFELIIVL